jgi:raffinose/stachyose/melibiose transport system substrate-binding protein
MKKRVTVVVLICCMLLTSFGMYGCSKPDNSTKPNDAATNTEATDTSKEDTSKEDTSKASAEEKEFEIAVPATEENQIKTYEGIFNQFISDYNTENNTNYKLKFSSAQSKDITNTRMSSNDKPDLFILDSPADVAQYVKEDLLLDVSSYAEAGKWSDTMFSWAYNLSKINDKVYTLPYGYEGIVLWYNKDIMAKLGLKAEDIDTKAEFENACQLAQDGGYTPIMLGTQDWPWAQEWYLSVMLSYTGRSLVKDVLQGNNGAKWTDDAFVKTIETYKSWHDKGYLADGKSYVLTSDDAINAFTNDKALFKLEGTWATYWITPLEQAQKDKIGVMLNPAINDTEKPHLPIAVGGMWCASKDTEAPDLAGYILNKLLTQDIQSDFLAAGLDVAPMTIDASEFESLDPVVKNMWTMLNDSLNKGDYGYTTYAFYPPDTRVYIYEGIVNVLENNTSIKDYLTQVQALTDKERAAGAMPVLP